MSPTLVITEYPTVLDAETTTIEVVEIIEQGERGLKGDKGDPGDSGDLTFVHVQAVPATTWSVVHNLGKFPSTTVVDSTGAVVHGAIDYVDNNHVTVTFTGQFSGKVYCN